MIKARCGGICDLSSLVPAHTGKHGETGDSGGHLGNGRDIASTRHFHLSMVWVKNVATCSSGKASHGGGDGGHGDLIWLLDILMEGLFTGELLVR